jgi:hypothetical protein
MLLVDFIQSFQSFKRFIFERMETKIGLNNADDIKNESADHIDSMCTTQKDRADYRTILGIINDVIYKNNYDDITTGKELIKHFSTYKKIHIGFSNDICKVFSPPRIIIMNDKCLHSDNPSDKKLFKPSQKSFYVNITISPMYERCGVNCFDIEHKKSYGCNIQTTNIVGLDINDSSSLQNIFAIEKLHLVPTEILITVIKEN